MAGVHAAEGWATCWDAAGRLYTVGAGHDGQLGHGTAVSRSTVKRVKSLRGAAVRSIACGQSYTCAVTRHAAVETAGLVGPVRGAEALSPQAAAQALPPRALPPRALPPAAAQALPPRALPPPVPLRLPEAALGSPASTPDVVVGSAPAASGAAAVGASAEPPRGRGRRQGDAGEEAGAVGRERGSPVLPPASAALACLPGAAAKAGDRCHACGALGHWKRDCPVRRARKRDKHRARHERAASRRARQSKAAPTAAAEAASARDDGPGLKIEPAPGAGPAPFRRPRSALAVPGGVFVGQPHSPSVSEMRKRLRAFAADASRNELLVTSASAFQTTQAHRAADELGLRHEPVRSDTAGPTVRLWKEAEK
jgi:hypothetical protein